MSLGLALILISGGAKPQLPPVVVMIPYSGQARQLGEEFMRGFDMAVGQDINYEIVDTHTSPDSVISALEVINGFPGASLVVGPLLSLTSLPAAEFCMRNRIPIILPTASELKLGTFGSYVFPFNYKAFLETAFVIEVLGAKLGKDSWVVLQPDRVETEAVVRWFNSVADTFGIHVIHTATYSEKDMSYDKLAKAVVGMRPRVIFMPHGSRASAMLFLSLRKRGFRGTVVGLDSWIDPDVVELAGGALGGLMVVAPDPGDFMGRALAEAQKEDFIQRYRQKFGVNPSDVARKGYDAGALAKEVCFDNPDRETVKKRLLHMGIYKGISGDIMVSKDPKYLLVYELTRNGFKKEETHGQEQGR